MEEREYFYRFSFLCYFDNGKELQIASPKSKMSNQQALELYCNMQQKLYNAFSGLEYPVVIHDGLLIDTRKLSIVKVTMERQANDSGLWHFVRV